MTNIAIIRNACLKIRVGKNVAVALRSDIVHRPWKSIWETQNRISCFLHHYHVPEWNVMVH